MGWHILICTLEFKFAKLVKTARKHDRFIEDLGNGVLRRVTFWIRIGFLDFGFGHELENMPRSIGVI